MRAALPMSIGVVTCCEMTLGLVGGQRPLAPPPAWLSAYRAVRHHDVTITPRFTITQSSQ
ncbi:hypothetical protein FDG2_0417 [Candidatus Protofrankia californiensis]|uniref:Uncharacterized protein n=1 Tax=Candidatus Protofrankia californiensis TaxID=1839754 RepID=A0A1C3NTH2_9ACTN|nr:hypothetical protein FDG2_0417 [Candidatus Protofrankia californiensis]